MLAWKTEGTRLYQALPALLHASLEAVRAAARDRRGGDRAGRRDDIEPGIKRENHDNECRGLRLVGVAGSEPRRLESYVRGEWVTGGGRGTDLFHAVTGAKIAEASTDGIDFGAMVEYARRVGGPALRRMTFHERALMLKAIAQYLMARKDEFYAVSAATGATKHDSWVDIEGGIGTFFAYASRGRREFPNETLLCRWADGGAVEGRHVRRPAHLRAARRRRRAHQRLQLPRVGNVGEARADAARRRAGDRQAGDGDVLPHRSRVPRDDRVGAAPGGRDSAALRQQRRSARSSRLPVRRRVHRVGVDRARCSRRRSRSSRTTFASTWKRTRSTTRCSGPTPRRARPEFDLFIKEVAREMTTKAGQKCTAIRRTLVPEGMIDGRDVARSSKRLDDDHRRRPVGRRRANGTARRARPGERSAEERRRARARHAELVYGNLDDFAVVGADRERGAFFPPLLFYAKDPFAATSRTTSRRSDR